MKYVVFADYDGTLTNDDNIVTKRTVNAIKELIKNNCYVVVCSSRPRYSVNWIKDNISSSGYIISSNGAEIYDADNKKVIFKKVIEKDICLDICYRAVECNSRIVLVADNDEYVTEVSHSEHQIIMDNYKEIIRLHDIKQIFITNNSFDEISKLKKYVLKLDNVKIINESLSLKNNFDDNSDYWFSVANKDVSKGASLKYLTNYLEIPLEHVYAIGNDYNDIEMFSNAGVSICFDNCPNDIKKMVDRITCNNNEDGAAKAFEQILREIEK